VPAKDAQIRACLLVAHPFAEELNKSRRMIALAAERIAAANYAVLEIDFLGCGDSSGDFADASWGDWISDLQLGYDWLSTRYRLPIWIWGVRAGALLASAFLERTGKSSNLLFWQAVLSGHQHLTQFVRLKSASEFLGQEINRSGTQVLVKRLLGGDTLEIGGYRLASKLARGLADAELNLPPSFSGRIVCLEVLGSQGGEISPALASRVHHWRKTGLTAQAIVAPGVPFWQTEQISEAPDLLDATLSCLIEHGQ
jgi:exosortase A-associated hydrolase 2